MLQIRSRHDAHSMIQVFDSLRGGMVGSPAMYIDRINSTALYISHLWGALPFGLQGSEVVGSILGYPRCYYSLRFLRDHWIGRPSGLTSRKDSIERDSYLGPYTKERKG